MARWIGVLVAAIRTVQHIRTRTVPLVRSFKARIKPRPLPFRYVLVAVMLTMLVVEVAMVKGMETAVQTGAAVTDIVQQTGINGFLNDLTVGIIPTASVAYTLWCNSFKTPTSTSSNGSFAFLPKNQFNSFMTKAINSNTAWLDFKSGYASFDITNWGEGDIVEWNSYGNIYQLRHKFSTAHLYKYGTTGEYYYIQTVVELKGQTPSFSLNAVIVGTDGNLKPTNDGMFSSMEARPSSCLKACLDWLKIKGRKSGPAHFGLTGHRTGNKKITIVDQLHRMTMANTHNAPSTSTTTPSSNKRFKTTVNQSVDRANGTLGDPKGFHPVSHEPLYGSHTKGRDGKPIPRTAFYNVLRELQGIVDDARDSNQVNTMDLLVHLCKKNNLTVVDGSVTNATQGIFNSFFSKIKNCCPGRCRLCRANL